MNGTTVQDVRDDFRSAEDELTRASHLHATVHEFSEKRSRGGAVDASDVVQAFETFVGPGPGRSIQDRRDALAYLAEDHLETDAGQRTDFFSAARNYRTRVRSERGTQSTTAGGTDLETLIDGLQGFVSPDSVAPPATRSDVVGTFDALAVSGSASMAGHLEMLTSLVVTAAEGRRDALDADLNNEFPSDSTDGDHIASKGAIQQFVDSVDDPVGTLSEDQPLALLPVRLETRFVGPEREDVGNTTELWVRIYPDQIHNDTHEEHLTDVEVRWGRNFWAFLWLASHETLAAGDIDRQYLESALDGAEDAGLIGLLLELDPAAFPSDAADRKDAIKERAWNQLLERFGRERAAYVVHELKPTGGVPTVNQTVWETLADTDVVIENADIRTELSSSGGLSFPRIDRKPDTWTRTPVSRLLPDQWIVYGIWTNDDLGLRETFVLRSNAIREPLPVGPTPQAMAVAEQYGDETTDGPADRGDELTAAVGPDADIAWITNFGEAEKAGMAVRIRDADVFDRPTPVGVDDLSDGTFEQLVVTGVKASMSADRTPVELERLFDAHHYTRGIELLERGTPTNNYDTTSGYTSTDDPSESMGIECGPPVLEHGGDTDGDRLARALGIDPVTTGSDEHVFAHVENADADYQTRAWHTNSALWSGTIGYYLQNMLTDATPPESVGDGSLSWSGMVPAENVREWGGLYEAYRRHFIDYVRAQGPLPAFRTGSQPYGVLPVMPSSEDRANPLEDDDVDVSDVSTGGDDESAEMEEPSVDPTIWDHRGDFGRDVTERQDLEEELLSTSQEAFRATYSVHEAHGAIPDRQLAETYPPEEAAKVFTKRELAAHYDRDAAARVLSSADLETYLSAIDPTETTDDRFDGDSEEGGS